MEKRTSLVIFVVVVVVVVVVVHLIHRLIQADISCTRTARLFFFPHMKW